MKNIVLIGMPGSGKTTIGSELSRLLSVELLDMDTLIEKQQGKSIPQLFHERGEVFFRQCESKLIREVSGATGRILSTGGGCVLNPENMRLLQESGIVFFIDRAPEEIIKTLQNRTRPLVSDPLRDITELYEKRIGLYRKYANIIIESGTGKPREIALKIAKYCRKLTSKNLAVIGTPIAHSLSPEIHRPVLELFTQGSSYKKFDPEKQGLEAFFSEAVGQFDGWNVTMPYKTKILSLLDEVHPEADFFHSVNTACIRNGRSYGFNTDGAGFDFSLKIAGGCFRDATVGVLGCGGAGGTVVLKAVFEGAREVAVFQRDKKKSELILERAKRIPSTTQLSHHDFDFSEMAKFCSRCDVLINATPLGMEGIPQDFEQLDFLKALPKHAIVCDLIYRPQETRFMKAASELGYRVVGGIEMLLYQGILAEEHFLETPFHKENVYQHILRDKAFLAAYHKKS